MSLPQYSLSFKRINLLGIDSVYCPMETRIALWKRMATDFKRHNLLKVMKTEDIARKITRITYPQYSKVRHRERQIVKL